MKRAVSAYGALARLVQAAILLLALAASPAAAADRLILAFGDSLTAGYGVQLGQAFPTRLEAALRRSGVAARVYNAGVSGDTTAAGRQRLGWVLRGVGAKPDLAIVELGANDMLRGLQPAETRANLDAILATLKQQHIPILIAGMRAAPNMGRAYATQFEPIFPAMAKKYGARLYPFFLDGVAGNRALLQADGMHPNPKGVEIVVAHILPAVKSALK